jgi:hypothetical protein
VWQVANEELRYFEKSACRSFFVWLFDDFGQMTTKNYGALSFDNCPVGTSDT